MWPRVLPLLFGLALTSCSTPVTLYTDESFRGSAPEILQAWQNPGWFHATQTVNLPPGSGLQVLEQAITSIDKDSRVLVGMALTSAERGSLLSLHPSVHWLFLNAPTTTGDDTGPATLSVLRTQAWNLVASAAARPGTALALFPLDATAAEIRRFEDAWNKAGGGPLTTSLGTQNALVSPLPDQVFQWAGPEADALVASLPATIPVHGNPGTARAPGAGGLVWSIRGQGLGAFLWSAAQSASQGPQYLPLETVFVRR